MAQKDIGRRPPAARIQIVGRGWGDLSLVIIIIIIFIIIIIIFIIIIIIAWGCGDLSLIIWSRYECGNGRFGL